MTTPTKIDKNKNEKLVKITIKIMRIIRHKFDRIFIQEFMTEV